MWTAATRRLAPRATLGLVSSFSNASTPYSHNGATVMFNPVESLRALTRNWLTPRRPSTIRNRSRLAIENLEERTLPTVSIPVVDLLVAYTTQAKNLEGGTTQIENQIK